VADVIIRQIVSQNNWRNKIGDFGDSIQILAIEELKIVVT
jgi:hypothetical protein